MTVDAARPSVFDAGLPTLSYDLTDTPQQIYPQFQAAQQEGADRIGTHWPRGTLVRTCPDGASRSAVRHPAGNTSLRPRDHVGTAVGQSHPQHLEHGRRRTPSTAQPGVQSVHAAGDGGHGRHDPRRRQRAHRSRRGLGPLRIRRGHRTAVPHPGHLRVARCTSRGLATVLTVGRGHLQDRELRLRSHRRKSPSSSRRGVSSTTTSTTWSRAGVDT